MTSVPGWTERRVFVDSSAFLALLDRRDEHHTEAIQILQGLAEHGARQFTPNATVMVAHALNLSSGGIWAGQAFLRSTEASDTTDVRVRASDEHRAREIIYRYNDKDYSLVDAVSFAIMERLHITRAFTFDRHLAQYGLTLLAPDLL